MEEITVKELCKLYGYNLKSLANEVGCSISLLSKIQNAKEGISNNIQAKFQNKFPEFKLTNGTYKYKDLYEQALADLKEANEIIETLEDRLNVALAKLDSIYKIAEEEI